MIFNIWLVSYVGYMIIFTLPFMQLLGSGKLLKQARWMFSYTYPEKLPLPLIIGAVHGVCYSIANM